MENNPLRSSRKIEGQAWFQSPAKLVELGWSPLVTVLYVVVSVATAGSLNYSVLAVLILLNITCIVYALKPHKIPEPPVENRLERSEPPRPEPRVELPREQREPPKPELPVEPPRDRKETPKPEPKPEPAPEPQREPQREPREAPKPEPRVEPQRELKEPRDDGALRKEVEAAKGELERIKRTSAALQSQIDEQAKRTAERLEITSAMTRLKEQARAIRRQWPDAAFCQRPLREQWWTPGATQSMSTSWLAKAHEWHTQFKEARARFFPGTPDNYLQSLDIEEVIDLLDGIVLSQDTPPLHRDTQVSPSAAPVLVITGWGAPEEEDEKCGFWIRNSGEIAASNIQLARASIGFKALSIYLQPSFALVKDQKVFVIATLAGPPRVTAYHLEDLMVKLPANAINGAKPLGIALKLVYDGKDGKRYASRHEMALENGVIKVGHVNTEVVAMQL
jgi:outer membrane biosynthesis protein TonB